mgnify:CR=1 FL=1
MNSVSPKQVDLYGKEINGIASNLLEQLDQIISDFNTIKASIEILKSYDKADASEVATETHYGEATFDLSNAMQYVEKTFKYFKYVWDISVDADNINEVTNIINNTRESINSLNLSGKDLNEFAAMLSSTISLIETEILGRRAYKKTSYSQYSGLSDLFNTIKDNDIWQEYKSTANYSKKLKQSDLLYKKYRTKKGNDDYVDFLLDEIGNHRMTTDNKNTKYAIWFNKKYGMINYNDAFCAAGVSYTLANTGNSKILNPYINVASGANDAQAKASQGIGTWHPASDTNYQPKRGDIFYKGGDHTGIILDSDEKYIYTIEANTSSDEGQSGYVNTRIRNLKNNPYITSGGFYSPPVKLSDANDKNIKLNNDYIGKKLAIQNGGNE